ncbi:MAG: DNA-processing protein DprA [Gemmatimonadota bacterium]|nr:DNA-processing protein DprA [Gemmatimonadota bacterium]
MEALSRRDREVAAFLSLERTPGLGVRGIRKLWEEHGSGRAALKAIGRAPPRRRSFEILREARRLRLDVMPLGDPSYPRSLLDLRDPPPVLFAPVGLLPMPALSIAVVGTRRSTPYGRGMARRIAGELAGHGWCVVSGMAAGIDAVAHEAVLDAGGVTLGVLGTGHRHSYPPTNRRLYARMRQRGWLVSEFEPSEGPSRAAFPRRNRIIAALARAVVVVEAGERSGALNTATHALDLGRPVLAVPARDGDPKGLGTVRLLRDGASCVTCAVDVFRALDIDLFDPSVAPPPRTGGGGEDGWALSGLSDGMCTASDLAWAASRPVSEAVTALGRLEIDGRVGRTADGRYYRRDPVPRGTRRS